MVNLGTGKKLDRQNNHSKPNCLGQLKRCYYLVFSTTTLYSYNFIYFHAGLVNKLQQNNDKHSLHAFL